MEILFAATGEIAVRTLEELNKIGLIKAVLTTVDEKGGRGNKVIESPIKIKALELGLPVYQFESLKSEARKVISSLGCDTLLSFCYGKIFGPKFLSLFENKFNIHPSLLPLYRGPSPTYAAIRNLDEKSGVSIQEIALEVDSGRLLIQEEFSLDGSETLSQLDNKVAEIASLLAARTFSSFSCPYSLKDQIGDVSYTEFTKKEDGKIDFSKRAKEIHAQIRACYPWPKAYVESSFGRIILSSVYGSAFDLSEKAKEKEGTVVALDKKKGLKIATKDYYIYVSRLQAPSKKEMDALSFVNGNKKIIGDVLT